MAGCAGSTGELQAVIEGLWQSDHRASYWRGHGSLRELYERMEEHRQRLAALDAQALFAGEPDFPGCFYGLRPPPAVVFVRGRIELLARDALGTRVAIVGSRAAFSHHLDQTRQLSRALVAAGKTVASGLALGVDGAAHRAALDRGGNTIAVIATGLDGSYPPRHRQLQREIADRGLLVSPFPPGAPPRRAAFHYRNQLIAALSAEVIVVAAEHRSGALITARYARELRRELAAVPGSPGCEALVASGVRAIDDCAAPWAASKTKAVQPVSQLGEALWVVLERLGEASLGRLASALAVDPGQLALELLTLEEQGLVQQGGGRYRRPQKKAAGLPSD